MPNIPLYTSPTHPDAWHQVRSPGGYEWWYFDADDIEHDRHIVVILFQGFVFHPGYLRRYFRYHRWPTRFAPPVPRDFPCAYFAVYEAGRIRWQFMTQVSPDRFVAAVDRPQVSVGPNQMTFDGARFNLHLQGTPWELTWRGPVRRDSQLLEARFSFTPKLPHPPMDRVFLSRQLSGAEHHWIIANPLCDVEGNIQLGSEQIAITGRGYHDHNWGTAPLGPCLRRWFWGRVLLEDTAYTFHFARPQVASLAEEVHLMECDATSLRELPVARVSSDWSEQTKLLLDYPIHFALDHVLDLRDPSVIDSAPFYMRLKYAASVRGRRGTALCEIAYPHRLRWPILGRMIEMSIDKRGVTPLQ